MRGITHQGIPAFYSSSAAATGGATALTTGLVWGT